MRLSNRTLATVNMIVATTGLVLLLTEMWAVGASFLITAFQTSGKLLGRWMRTKTAFRLKSEQRTLILGANIWLMITLIILFTMRDEVSQVWLLGYGSCYVAYNALSIFLLELIEVDKK